MNAKTTWTVSDISQTVPMRSNDLEFQDDKGEWHHFTIIATPQRIVFGGVCNAGFLESGYIVRDEPEHLDETLTDLCEDLEAYYNHGPQYVSRIIHNERM